MDLLELNERVRLVERKSGLILDVICLAKKSKIILALATTVNLPKLFELNEFDYPWINSYFIDIVTISSRSLNQYEVQELTEKPNFVKLENLYSLFKDAKKIFLIATLTAYSHKKRDFNDSDAGRDKKFNVIYLKVDNLYTEIIIYPYFKENSTYVYVFQSDFEEDLSLSLCDSNQYYDKKIFNKKINVKPLSFSVLEEYFKGEESTPPTHFIGVDFEEFILFASKFFTCEIKEKPGKAIKKERYWGICD